MRLLHNKKAINLVGMIIMLLGFFVLLAFFSRILFAAVPESDSNGLACHTLIGMKRVSTVASGGSINAVTQRCYTINAEIPGDNKISNSFQIEKLFADEIENAWWMIHEGSEPAMWDQDSWRFLDAPKACVILKTIIYQKEDRLDYVIDKNEFFRFLNEETSVIEEGGNTWTYIEYIQSYGRNPAIFQIVSKTHESGTNWDLLVPGNEYAIAVESGGGRFDPTDSGDTNTVYFGLKEDVMAKDCIESVPDELS